MYLFRSFRCHQDWFRSFIIIFLIVGFFSVLLRFFLSFLGTYRKVVIYFYKLLFFIRLFWFFSVHWRFVLTLSEFSVNFKDFCKFLAVLWIFLGFIACSSLVFDFRYLFWSFGCFRDYFNPLWRLFLLLGFLKFCKIFPRLYGSL